MGQLPRYYINKCNAIKHDKIRVMKLRTSYQSNERTAPLKPGIKFRQSAPEKSTNRRQMHVNNLLSKTLILTLMATV